MGSVEQEQRCSHYWYEKECRFDSKLKQEYFLDNECPGSTKTESMLNSLQVWSGMQSCKVDSDEFRKYEKDTWKEVVRRIAFQLDKREKSAGDESFDSELVDIIGSLFAAANYLKRPIIVLPIYLPRHTKVKLNGIVGMYLPVMYQPGNCSKSPVFLGYDSGTFSVIVCDRAPQMQLIYAPIVFKNKNYLPIRLAKNEVGVYGKDDLLNRYLDTHWIQSAERGIILKACSADAKTQPRNRLQSRSVKPSPEYHLMSCIPSSPIRDMGRAFLPDMREVNGTDNIRNRTESGSWESSPLRKCRSMFCPRYSSRGKHGFCLVCAEENVECLTPYPTGNSPTECTESESQGCEDSNEGIDIIPKTKHDYANIKDEEDISRSPELNLLEHDFGYGASITAQSEIKEQQPPSNILCKNLNCTNVGVEPCKGYCHQCLDKDLYASSDFSEVYSFHSTNSLENGETLALNRNTPSENLTQSSDYQNDSHLKSSRERKREHSGSNMPEQKRSPRPLISLDVTSKCRNDNCENEQAPVATPYCNSCLREGQVSQSVHSELYSFKEDSFLGERDVTAACATPKEAIDGVLNTIFRPLRVIKNYLENNNVVE